MNNQTITAYAAIQEYNSDDTPIPALSDKERAVMNKLVEAWNLFVMLKPLHPYESDEFCRSIHSAQYILMSRPVRRQLNT